MSNLSLHLATQARLRALADTQARLQLSGSRLRTHVQRVSHARMLEGLDLAWIRYVRDWEGIRAKT